MINLILYLDGEELWDCDENKLHIQQALGQKSWELRRLYGLPETDGREEAPVFSVLEEKMLFGCGAEVQAEIIKNISIRIGNNREWRLLLFLASEKEPLGNKYRWLEKFLSQMMYYGVNKLPGLTCELPEQIWIITLRDIPAGGITPAGMYHYDRTVHGDEQVYADYPPNCRFICYGLDYRKENYFDREMLKMHCAVRCLARPIFSTDLLKGNQIYLLEAEWNEEKLCSGISEYNGWLGMIKNMIRNIGETIKEEWLDDSVIARPPVPVPMEPDIKKDGQKPVEIKRKTESAIEKADTEYRRSFKRYREKLNVSLKRQGNHILLKNRESVLKEDMYEKERNMYENTVKKSRRLKCGYTVMESLFKIKNWFIFKDKNNQNEKKLELEKEISDYDNQIQVMRQYAVRRIAEAAVYIGLCFFITWLAGIEIGKNNDFFIFILYMVLMSVCAIIVFYSFLIVYMRWRKWLYNMFIDSQKMKIISNENYFKLMLDYFRLKSILNFHTEQKKKKKQQDEMYRQWEQDWKKYDGICNQLRISSGITDMGVSLAAGRGDIQEMLQKKQYKKLYSLYEEPMELTVNGVIIFVPFTFIKEIKLTKIYNIK